MVQLEYNGIMKRTDVKVPFTLADESDTVMVASITEDNRITLHRDLSIKLLRQILLSWDEKEHMDTERAKREEGEHDELLEDKPKNEKLTYLEERLQISWKDISINEIEMSTRVHWCLQAAGIRTVGELVENKESEIIKLRNFGRKSLTELQEILSELGLQFKQ